MEEKELTDIDKVAMAEAYRVFQLLPLDEQAKIPEDFVDRLILYGDFKKVKPFKNKEEMQNYDLSDEAMYLIMYMCTFK